MALTAIALLALFESLAEKGNALRNLYIFSLDGRRHLVAVCLCNVNVPLGWVRVKGSK